MLDDMEILILLVRTKVPNSSGIVCNFRIIVALFHEVAAQSALVGRDVKVNV